MTLRDYVVRRSEDLDEDISTEGLLMTFPK